MLKLLFTDTEKDFAARRQKSDQTNLQLHISRAGNPVVEAEQEDAGDQGDHEQRRRAASSPDVHQRSHHPSGQSSGHGNAASTTDADGVCHVCQTSIHFSPPSVARAESHRLGGVSLICIVWVFFFFPSELLDLFSY